MRRSIKSFGVFLVAASLVAVWSSAGAMAATSARGLKGNASGGALEQIAAKSPLQGPKGTGLTRGVTSTQIKVGCVTQVADFPGYAAGIQARFARANKTGINGRKIDLIPCKEDGTSAQTDLQNVQELVSQNNVFAMLGISDELTPASTNYLNNNQVPTIGWFNPGFCTNRWGFSWNGCVLDAALPKGAIAHGSVQGNLASTFIKASGMPASKVRLAVLAENSPAGAAAISSYKAAFGAAGAQVVSLINTFPANYAAGDVTPYVQQVLAANPNIILFSTSFAGIATLAGSLKAAGYKGIIGDFETYVPGLLASSAALAGALSGEYVNTQIVPQEENTPWTKQEVKDLTAIGQPAQLSFGASLGYASAELLVEMLQAAGKNLNTKTFDQAVNGGKFVAFASIKGGPGKLDWPAAHILASDCAAVLKTVGTGYKVVVPYACYQSTGLF